jgi:hypothetical protein
MTLCGLGSSLPKWSGYQLLFSWDVHRVCTIKHYRFMIYGKRTYFVINWYLFYCQSLSLACTNILPYYGICTLRICNVTIAQSWSWLDHRFLNSLERFARDKQSVTKTISFIQSTPGQDILFAAAWLNFDINILGI